MSEPAKVVAVAEQPPEDDSPDVARIPTRPIPPLQPSGLLISLTRFAIGGVMLGVSAARRYLAEWEETLAHSDHDNPDPNAQVLRPTQQWEAPAGEVPTQQLRHAAVGLIFESQDRLAAARQTVDRFSRSLFATLAPPMNRLPIPHPVRHRYQSLVDRGDHELARLVSRGRAETTRSEALAALALRDLLDIFIDLLAESEQLNELVHEQSVGLADEAIEEVRERTVTGDILVERLARRLLHLPPREILPQPTAIIRELIQAQKRNEQP